jgi:hypothetical protein
MSLTVAWTLIKTFGPWILLGLVITAVGLLWVDRNSLAAQVAKNNACLASVQGEPGSSPIGSVCPAPITVAVTTATQANACDALLKANPGGVPVVCSQEVQVVAGQEQADRATIASQAAALAQAKTNTDEAVARASARATQAAQRSANDQAVLAAAPRNAAGDLVLNADGLRKLAAQ